MNAWITATLLLPIAAVGMYHATEALFWCFCWCFCKADTILQDRHWQRRVTADDLEALRKAFEQ